MKYKKLLSILAITLLTSVAAIPVNAEEIETDKTNITLSLDEVKNKLVEGNIDLKLLEINLDKLYSQLDQSKDDLDDVENAQGDYYYNLEQLEAKLTSIKNEKDAFIADQADQATPPLSTEEYIEKLLAYDNQIERITRSIESLQNSKNSLENSENSLNAGIDSIHDTIEVTKESQEITKEKLKYNVETIYIEILSLDLESDKAESKAAQAKSIMDYETLKHSLGLTTDMNVQNAKENHSKAINDYNSISKQKQSLMNQLKTMMGYPIRSNVLLENIAINDMVLSDYQDGLKEVLEKGAEIAYQELLCENQEDYIDNLEEEYNGSENQIKNEKLKLHEYELKLELTILNTESAYYDSYNSLNLLKSNLTTLEKQLKLAEAQNIQDHLKYALGLISKKDLLAKDTEYLQAKLSFEQKQYEYAKAVATYNMVAKGYLVK